MMYRNILVPIDVAHESSWRRAIPTAIELAKCFGATLTITTVVRDIEAIFTGYFPPGYAWMIDRAQNELQRTVNSAVPAELKPTAIAGHGGIAREIIRMAQETGADLIVMASHRPEMKDYLIGPNAAAVASAVLLIQAPALARLVHIAPLHLDDLGARLGGRRAGGRDRGMAQT